MTWQQFVVEYGWRARGDWLSHVLDVQKADIARLRWTGACRRRPHALGFAELFTKWHGRPPRDEEWPAPMKIAGGYEWLQPEYALLARLVGTIGPNDICCRLTERLRQFTGNAAAERNRNMLNVGMQRIGLQTKDVVGGVTVEQAAREIGTRAILDHEIRKGRLLTNRIGRYVVIPHEEFARWKATRVHPPKGYVRLRAVQAKLGIKSDKLSEYARAGYVPTAVCCNTYASGGASTRWGTWWMDPKAARKLIADRRAGRPMPWHGKPELGNLKITFRLWSQRKHPARCATCRDIWGPDGAPATFDEYVRRYPPLAHGAKRHLTMPYSDGLTRRELAREARVSDSWVQRAIDTGVLRAHQVGRTDYITRTDATRWLARRCPTGDSARCWISFRTARRWYVFTNQQLRQFIAGGRLRYRVGDVGAQIGLEMVLRQQCRELRDELGYSEREAARRVGVSVPRLRVLLRALDWRQAHGIPLDTVNACIKRLQSKHGLTVAEAARRLRKPRSWVQSEINAGTVRPLRTKWDKHRLYITMPMFRRLQEVARHPLPRTRWTAEMREVEWRAEPRTRMLKARNSRRVPADFVPLQVYDAKGGKPAFWPKDLQVREFPA